METSVQRPSRLLLRATILAAAALLVMLARPAGGAIPASATVGRVIYADLNGTVDVTTSIRSFTMMEELVSAGGFPTFGAPRVVQDVIGNSPFIMNSIARGLHHPSVTVILYWPSTTTRFQQWSFSNTKFSLDAQAQNGPASATPWQTVSWTYQRVRQQVYQADGVTVVSNVCYDTIVREIC
jgi:hypothetical protein